MKQQLFLIPLSVSSVVGLGPGVLHFGPFLAGVFSPLEGLNTRKTRVFAFPGARKNVENAPQNPRKIRGFGWETSVFARFGYVFGVKNVAKPSENAVFPAGTS